MKQINLEENLLIEGTVTHLIPQGVCLDIGSAHEGLVPYDKWTYKGTYQSLQNIILGTKVKVMKINDYIYDSGYITLSKIKADAQIAKEKIKEIEPGDICIENAQVLNLVHNKFGEVTAVRVLLENCLFGYLPISQAEEDYKNLIGQTIPVQILPYNSKHPTILVSVLHVNELIKFDELANNNIKWPAEVGIIASNMKKKEHVIGKVKEVLDDHIIIALCKHVLAAIFKKPFTESFNKELETSIKKDDRVLVKIKNVNQKKGLVEVLFLKKLNK